MLDFLFSTAIVVLTAWLGRMLLDARELGWGRLLLAALLGIGVGDATALFLMASDVADLANIDYSRLQLVSMPFRVIGTMGAIVVLELFFRGRRRTGGGTKGLGAAAPQGRMLNPAVLGRALQVSRILTRHGFAPLVGWGRGRGSSIEGHDLARRAREAFEEAGGIFIKLGQLLATRPDLVTPAAMLELAKLQSAVAPLDEHTVRTALEAQLGRPLDEVFATVDFVPLGSASVAQAHAAVLRSGADVVVKVRRPGLEKVIGRDLVILRWLARTAEGRFSWARKLGTIGLAAEFADALVAELDFATEARSIAEIAAAVAHEPLVQVPQVHGEFTRPGLIVMERLIGPPLATLPSGAATANSERLADALCNSQVRAMLDGERFHGDPHPGNVLILEDGRLGLIDLGLSSKLDTFERTSVFQMLLGMHQRQPALVYEALVTIGAVDPAVHEPDEIERALARFMAAYLGPGMPPAQALTDLLRLTLELGLRLPASTNAMFRALATLTGTVERLHPGYPVIDKVAEIGGNEFRRRLKPDSVADFVRQEWAELSPLLGRFPRHVDRLATMLAHGRLSTQTRVLADPDDRSFVERLANRFVLTLLSVGVGAVSVMLLGAQGGIQFPFFDIGLYEVLGWIGLFIAMTLMFRVLLAVLKSEGVGPASRP